ncbi:beta-ketoacyl-[acyl-carrier-protein] synthase family protein [Photorhabdus laumondii]|uniref:Beta-ketoacyl synthase n=1 Tax=Photorhabdus laumondii subsp. clarkei TaxID=2029685 RepID=A0A329VBT3_9GAMM|nr:beta-ketoacyl-[acyl-carrier-protein] synthase family protein [Photorhabdus laumondii]RAW85765.1 beta-ketoacyl synthase [Photorhabdus laumondii subsp. clarkei]
MIINNRNESQPRRVVVTGLGVVAPTGVGVNEFWNNIHNGKSGVSKYEWGRERFGFKSGAIGKVHGDDSNNKEFVLKSERKYLQFALDASEMAMQDANLKPSDIDGRRFGVAIATAIADAAGMEECLLRITKGGKENIHPDLIKSEDYDSFDFSSAATSVAKKYGASMSVSNISTGCAAGLDALGIAMEHIRYGRADIMLAGASEAPLCPLSIGSFEALGALSSRELENQQAATCPFSLERDGFVIAEGCGILILESYEHAKQRGAHIYAELAGYASVNNAYHMTDLPADGMAMARCIDMALKDAQISPSTVNYISAHGSSTAQNDINESNAIKFVLGESAFGIPINSLKSMTGHALAAANAIESVALCLEIEKQYVHPTINYQTPDPDCDLDYIPNQGCSYPIKTALKLSSGFSGIHSVIVMRAVDNA